MGGASLQVDPHFPQNEAFVPSKEPLPFLPHLERNEFTDLLESPTTSGMGFIHFAVSRASSQGQALLAGQREANLLYMSHVRGAYCTVAGRVSVLEDPEALRRYWKSSWNSSFPVFPAQDGEEAPPAYTHSDVMLVRIAVTNVALHGLVEGPGRWDGKQVQLAANDTVDGGDRRWCLT